METHNLVLYSRSAVVSDWSCPRRRYWNYEYGGRGLTPDTTNLALFLGQSLHDGLAAIAHGLDIEDIAPTAVAQVREMLLTNSTSTEVDAEYFAAEQSTLVEGLLRGYARHTWPILQRLYPEVVCVEKEMTFEHDGLTFMAKPDLIVRDEAGDLVYLEFKSTSSVKDQWINSWTTAVQLHSSVRAVEATLGEKVGSVVIVGLNKGYVSYGKQNSPMCYGYFRSGNPPFNADEWLYDYKAGYRKYPIWQRDGGAKRWIDEMPDHILASQFPMTPPIMLNDDLIDAFFKQRARREHAIRHGRELLNKPGVDQPSVLDEYFPQNFEQCSPGWGSGCSYKRLCHGQVDNPLTAGFAHRHSHHDIEEAALNG